MKYLIRIIIFFISVPAFSENVEVKDIFSLSPIPSISVRHQKRKNSSVGFNGCC